MFNNKVNGEMEEGKKEGGGDSNAGWGIKINHKK
jgi:hypothetical protein